MMTTARAVRALAITAPGRGSCRNAARPPSRMRWRRGSARLSPEWRVRSPRDAAAGPSCRPRRSPASRWWSSGPQLPFDALDLALTGSPAAGGDRHGAVAEILAGLLRRGLDRLHVV